MNDQQEPLRRAQQSLMDRDFAVAERIFRELLRSQPHAVECWRGLGEACSGLARHGEAAQCYQRVLTTMPQDIEAHVAMGVAYALDGRIEPAMASFRHALHLQPRHPRAAMNLGVALAQTGRPLEAIGQFETAIRHDPGYAEAHFNLGNTYLELRRRNDAVQQFRKAIALKPDYAEALNNLGLTLTELHQSEAASVHLEQAIRLKPDYVEAHNNLGLGFADQGRFPEAVDCYDRALRLRPKYFEAITNLASAYKEQGKFPEALAAFELALAGEPNSASTHWNRALTWLQMGDYGQGWPEYEWRWKRKQSPMRPFTQPLWDGTPLDGRTVLLHPEQGLGDTIQFIRYAERVEELGGRTIVECPPRLAALLRTVAGIDELVAEGEPLPAFDCHIPLMSLPAALKTTLETVPNRVPYLGADSERIERWRPHFANMNAYKIGITWQGNPHHAWDRHRSIPLKQFAPLAEIEGVQLVSLQQVHGLEQIPAFQSKHPLERLPGPIDEDGGFLDTAAIMTQLDLVVTADTAIAHLAGALGIPVWLALATVTDWRWLWDRDDSPWYPTMRLFRQRRLGNWNELFARMAVELAQRAVRRGIGGIVQIPAAAGELLDKLTILEIKRERITDPAKLAHVQQEWEALDAIRKRSIPESAEIRRWTEELQAVNSQLWEVEDRLREHERKEEFGPPFVALARSVYRHNDARAALKRRINEHLQCPISEQKSYGETHSLPRD